MRIIIIIITNWDQVINPFLEIPAYMQNLGTVLLLHCTSAAVAHGTVPNPIIMMWPCTMLISPDATTVSYSTVLS